MYIKEHKCVNVTSGNRKACLIDTICGTLSFWRIETSAIILAIIP